MKCPECGKPAEPKGAGYMYHGKQYVPMCCTACGYFWGAPAAELAAPAVAEKPPSKQAEPPANDTSDPPAEKIVARADGFDPEKVAVGDVVLFEIAGEQKRLTVVSVAAKSVLGDVDGKPDRRIRKDDLTGAVAKA